MNSSTTQQAPIYWDGSSTLFTTDTAGKVRVFEEAGNPLEIAERKWQEDRDAQEQSARAQVMAQLDAIKSRQASL